MSNMTINFYGQNYIATYNSQTGYYEADIETPELGGIYDANITFVDYIGEISTDIKTIQIFTKEEIKIESNKVFMWIFDYKDFSIKDIVEIADYEINIDEETNANTILKVLKKTTAKAKDIVVIKKNNEVIYWGIVDNIQNENGKNLYEYTLKYITNLFDQKIELQTTDKTINETNAQDGLYVIKYNVDTSLVWDVNGLYTVDDTYIFAGSYNGGANQFFELIKQPNGYYKIEIAHSKKFVTLKSDNSNDVVQYKELNNDTQLWKIERLSNNQYAIKSKSNNMYIRVRSNKQLRADTSSTSNTDIVFQLVRKTDESLMKYMGVEELIRRGITANFVNSSDNFTNKSYIQVNVKTQTPKQTSVTNVENNIYNLHTWMTNCTQNYDVLYKFQIGYKKLVITIEANSIKKELIDVKAQPISNYTEVFETNIVSKVVVLTSTNTYALYLLNDRTTTTDATNPNRAEGRVETVYTEKYEDAPQKALDVMKANSYNHNITFNYYDRLIKIGTPIAIKTKESLIFYTYISAIKITPKKFIEYICGNIRINFIDKLLKERNN